MEKSRIHYGGISCYSCRSFFRRISKSWPGNYKCRRNEDCNITEWRRRNCISCRYTACVESGMKKTLVLSEVTKRRRFWKKYESFPEKPWRLDGKSNGEDGKGAKSRTSKKSLVFSDTKGTSGVGVIRNVKLRDSIKDIPEVNRENKISDSTGVSDRTSDSDKTNVRVSDINSDLISDAKIKKEDLTYHSLKSSLSEQKEHLSFPSHSPSPFQHSTSRPFVQHCLFPSINQLPSLALYSLPSNSSRRPSSGHVPSSTSHHVPYLISRLSVNLPSLPGHQEGATEHSEYTHKKFGRSKSPMTPANLPEPSSSEENVPMDLSSSSPSNLQPTSKLLSITPPLAHSTPVRSVSVIM